MEIKETILGALGVLGAGIASLFGGWDASMTTLLIFMAVDYVTGIIVAGVFHRSNKTESGALESRAGWKGLCRKGGTLLVVLVAARIDALLNTTYFRDGTCVAFIANEALSITENVSFMGVPMPAIVTKAIEVMKAKANDSEEEEN